MKGYITLQEPTFVKEVIIDCSELTTSYTQIYDFSNNSLARSKSTGIGIKNTTNTDIVLKFGSLNNQENERTIDAGDAEVLDNFTMVGVLYAKSVGEAPIIGRLKVWAW